jgi:crossover junction endodeoxyribonuclease RuvC
MCSACLPTSRSPTTSSQRRPYDAGRGPRRVAPVIVLGIDPGTAATGYGVVERSGSRLRLVDYGCLETIPDRSPAERLLLIHEGIVDLIQTHRPDFVGVERLFFNKNVQTAFAVGQARGVVLLAAAQHGVGVFEYGPHEVKLAVTGYGRAPKDQVQRMVQAVLGMTTLPRPDDAADALAVAICLAHGQRSAA